MRSTGKSEELELKDSIVHDTLVLADGKLPDMTAVSCAIANIGIF